MDKSEELKVVINRPGRAVITTHQKPDADALGSSLGIASYLKKKGHEVSVIAPTDFPDFLTWMDRDGEVIIYSEEKHELAEKLVSEADLIFCLDFNSLDRINEVGGLIRDARAIKVMIDHHLEPEHFADFEIWDIKAAATAELVFDMIKSFGDRELIDKHIAECLYAGIMTDTGGFRHTNTTEKSHLIVAELMQLEADAYKVGKLIYDNNSVHRLKFTGFALSERLKVLDDYNTAYIYITAEDLKRFNSQTGDTEGLVNYALSIKNIVFAAIIIDRGEGIKLSFRSIGEFSVNEFARKHFEGGGHQNAAGGKSTTTLEETIAKFEELLKEYRLELHPENHTQRLKV